jgi:hypothetical protein
MKKSILCIALLLPYIWINSQTTEAEKQLKTQQADSVNGWKKGGLANLSTSQTSLTNWAAGGQSSMAFSGLLSLFANNKKEKGLWENSLDLAYGSMKQGKTDWWKTDDKIDFTSKYGFKTSKNLYLAGLLNFKTQFANGYNYPNDSVKISGFMAPGYLLGAIGIDYSPGEYLTLFFAPLTGKFTFVNDQNLSDAGSFGINPGDNVYSEFGSYIRIFLKKDLMENISFQTKLDLFSNYLHNPQNIDVSWETLISMKVNQLFSATLTTHLVYDDDIIIPDKGGPRVQFKEVLAIGISYKF